MHKCWSVLSHVAPSNRAQRRCTLVHTLGLDRDKRWQFCKLTRSIKGQSAQQRDRLDGTQLGVEWMKEIWEEGGRRLKESFKKTLHVHLIVFQGGHRFI